jgi:hypothetical protein
MCCCNWKCVKNGVRMCVTQRYEFINTPLSMQPLVGTSSQNSPLLHDLCQRVCEPQLAYMDAHAAVMLNFTVMKQTHSFAVQIMPKICFVMSPNPAVISFSFSDLPHLFYLFSYCLKWNLFLKAFLQIYKLFPV